jgi:signal transduction histidine kinase
MTIERGGRESTGAFRTDLDEEWSEIGWETVGERWERVDQVVQSHCSMLHEFMSANRAELVSRCRTKVTTRATPGSSSPVDGISVFIDLLIETLRDEQVGAHASVKLGQQLGKDAGHHGGDLLRRGFTVAEVVHDYGDLCQALTELAHERGETISVDEFHTFNRCLDNAMADAVTAFSHLRDGVVSEAGTASMNERLGGLAHELRNQLNVAMLAFGAIKSGSVALTGATGAVLERSLAGLRDLIDRTLADVRLTSGLQVRRESIWLENFVDEIQVPVILEAAAKGLVFTRRVEADLVVNADRPMLSSAVANLLQNAMKFTAHGRISLTVRRDGPRVLIEIEDECGGLPAGTTERLFTPFSQLGKDRSGLGLGLSISRRSVEANDGTLSVRDLPGKGCIFTISLPFST